MAILTIPTNDGPLAIQVREGTLLSDALSLHGQAPDMPCGGKGRCGKCRVRAEGALSPLSATEEKYLSREEVESGVRLACCVTVEGDASVGLFEGKAVSQIRTEGISADFENDPMFEALGAAVDIGTTTLAARLYDRSGLLASAAAPNPQAPYGADVITRVGRAMAGDGALLAEVVQKAIAGLLETMCREAGRQTNHIDGLVITGNTAMLHLLTETDPSPLAAAPFDAKELFGKTVSASSLKLPCAENARVYLPRCMSAFVGGDITTALLASGICQGSETALLVDIGTNGEMALWRDGRLTCCSTAAGPAFEGANLSQGMQGAAGAIDRAKAEDGVLKLHTIGDVEAVGICGSGVADVLAGLLDLEVLDETGYLDGDEDAYALTDKVAFTQGDIRQVQLAKSAIRAGLETLLHRAGLTAGGLDRLDIAGGFGSYLDLNSGAKIGLLPEEALEKSRVLGNAALSGAAMLLLSQGLQGESEALAKSAKTAELSTDPVFMDNYVEYMMF